MAIPEQTPLVIRLIAIDNLIFMFYTISLFKLLDAKSPYTSYAIARIINPYRMDAHP
jgi:hypothetical protein